MDQICFQGRYFSVICTKFFSSSKVTFLLLNGKIFFFLIYINPFNSLRATSCSWGSRLVGTKYYIPDASQLTEILCIKIVVIIPTLLYCYGTLPLGAQNSPFSHRSILSKITYQICVIRKSSISCEEQLQCCFHGHCIGTNFKAHFLRKYDALESVYDII